VACNCGYAYDNFTELKDLHARFSSQGLRILAFHCNSFPMQAGGHKAIKDRYRQHRSQVDQKHDLDMPYDEFSKVRVNDRVHIRQNANGEDYAERVPAHPLFRWLKNRTGSQDIDFNFVKFLVRRDGMTVTRYNSHIVVSPPSFLPDVEQALQEAPPRSSMELQPASTNKVSWVLGSLSAAPVSFIIPSRNLRGEPTVAVESIGFEPPAPAAD